MMYEVLYELSEILKECAVILIRWAIELLLLFPTNIQYYYKL